MRSRRTAALFAASLLLAALLAQAQPPPGRGRGPQLSPREAAPIDFTGYWVSVVSEDWRWRMVTPAKGDFAGIPFTPEGGSVGEAWDAARDEASGDVCKAYGAAAIMRLPGRLHITWQDDSTLKIETDTGMQTRLLQFGGNLRRISRLRVRDIRRRSGSRPSAASGCRVRDSEQHAMEIKARPSRRSRRICCPATFARTASR